MKERILIAVWRAKQNWKDNVVRCLLGIGFGSAILAGIDGDMGGKHPVLLYTSSVCFFSLLVFLLAWILVVCVLVLRALLNPGDWIGLEPSLAPERSS